jgi:hypothetical protein
MRSLEATGLFGGYEYTDTKKFESFHPAHFLFQSLFFVEYYPSADTIQNKKAGVIQPNKQIKTKKAGVIQCHPKVQE